MGIVKTGFCDRCKKETTNISKEKDFIEEPGWGSLYLRGVPGTFRTKYELCDNCMEEYNILVKDWLGIKE